jgi:hypothetical protein
MSEQKRIYWEQETLKYNWSHARMRLVAETIKDYPTGTSVLDLGAGKALLAHLLGPSYPYYGLDIVGNKSQKLSWPIVRACDFENISQVELPNAPYDIIVISGLLEYLDNWAEFLQYVTTHWLSEGGICIVSFTNRKGYEKAPIQEHNKWNNILSLPEIIEGLLSLNLRIEKIFPLLWGNKYWSLPIVKILSWFSDQSGHKLWLDQFWISQFLCITRQRNDF